MYDYHSHTSFSDDCVATPTEMIEAAIKLGVREFAITDHYDPDYPDPAFPFELDFKGYHAKLLEAERDYRDRIKIVKGIEIGIQHGETLSRCHAAAKRFNYDFILGSFHCFDGVELYRAKYEEMDPYKILGNFYSYCYSCMNEYLDFDILAHINVIDRYVGNVSIFKETGVKYFESQGFKKSYASVMEIIEAMLSLLIRKDKGLEINTSAIRYNLSPRTVPSSDILKLYADLGGKIITFGSDAHTPRQIQEGFEGAYSLAKAFGFKEQATFENRKIEMVAID